jgi:hypothetical protein
MRDELFLQYERLTAKALEVKQGQDEELAFYAGNPFKGKCYICGKVNHKGANCRERIKKQRNVACGNGSGKTPYRPNPNQVQGYNNRFNRNCNYCHKYDHKVSDCHKKKTEQGHNKIAEIAEVSCIAECFPDAIDVALMTEDEFELGYCVHCGGTGRLGTFCDRCVDSGCIYASKLFEDEGCGTYWEPDPDNEDSTDISSKESESVKK